MGAVVTTRSATRFLPDGSRVILVGSIAHRIPTPGVAEYAASNAAIDQLARGWARDFGPRGITVNVVQPGAMEGGSRQAADATWGDLSWTAASPQPPSPCALRRAPPVAGPGDRAAGTVAAGCVPRSAHAPRTPSSVQRRRRAPSPPGAHAPRAVRAGSPAGHHPRCPPSPLPHHITRRGSDGRGEPGGHPTPFQVRGLPPPTGHRPRRHSRERGAGAVDVSRTADSRG